jgi:transcriptional regulator with XRE-family HTH domain
MYLGKFEHGKVIRRLRMERQLSIEDLAELIGEDPKFIRELEAEMYPDLELGPFFYLAKAFKMRPHELTTEIEKENIDFLNRVWTYRGSKNEVMTQRDKQRRKVFQKEITHNFKNKHTKHPFKKKIANKKPSVSTRKTSYFYDDSEYDN